MNANQSCRNDDAVSAPPARLERAGTGSNDVSAFAGDIRTRRAPFRHSRVHERALNRVMAARCTDLVLLARIGAPFED